MKKKVLIVGANFYKDITTRLMRSSIRTLGDVSKVEVAGGFGTIDSALVKGVFEIPVVIARHIKKYDAFVALGCVIKGETPHFDFISKSTIDAIMNLSIVHKKPIGNGILTCLNKGQAEIRSIDKGNEAAKAVIAVLSKQNNKWHWG